MRRFLFVSLPLTGHLDWGGMLATAQELARRGHAVAWASAGPTLRNQVVGAGVDFLPLTASGWLEQPPLPTQLPADRRRELRQQRGLDSWLSPAVVAQAAAELAVALASWRPDMLVAEPYAVAAALAAETAGLPLAVCGRPALPDPERAPVHPAGQRLAQLWDEAGLAGRYCDLAHGQIRSPLLHVDFFNRRWYADLPAIAGQTRFVGGRAGARPQRPAEDQPPRVLITLGSLFRQDPAFFRIAAEAVMLEGGQPLVVTGQREGQPGAEGLHATLPHGVDVRSWVDFSITLPTLAAIIHHGGVGTTHAALRHGLPQAAAPHAGDQQPQAGRITQAGVGYGVRPADFTLVSARWLARQLLGNAQLRATAGVWRSELQALGGAPAAASALENLLR